MRADATFKKPQNKTKTTEKKVILPIRHIIHEKTLVFERKEEKNFQQFAAKSASLV